MVKETSYTARHTWASIAYNNNVPKTTISKGLGHASFRTSEKYICELADMALLEANKVVEKEIYHEN